jgi:hypothetical protein
MSLRKASRWSPPSKTESNQVERKVVSVHLPETALGAPSLALRDAWRHPHDPSLSWASRFYHPWRTSYSRAIGAAAAHISLPGLGSSAFWYDISRNPESNTSYALPSERRINAAT